MQIAEFETAYVERDGGVGRIVLNRPERRNAISPQLAIDIQGAIDVVENDDEIVVVIVKGNGTAFCSGYDMTAHVVGDGGEMPKPREQWEDFTWTEDAANKYTRLWKLRKPTIAQVHGYCLAGGCMLALQCDLVYVSEDVRIGQPQVRALGMNPDFALWPLTIGLRQSKELLYTGDVVSGTEAAELKMVNKVLPNDQLETYVEWMAERISLVPRSMLQYTKQAVNEAADSMGYQGMILAGIHADTLQHFLQSNHSFKDQLRADKTAKMAVKDRDQRQGGLRDRRTLWEEHLADRQAATGADQAAGTDHDG